MKEGSYTDSSLAVLYGGVLNCVTCQNSAVGHLDETSVAQGLPEGKTETSG